MAKPAPRLFVEADLAQGRDVPLSKPAAHYLGTVLRLGEGAEVLLFNGRDGEWRGRIAQVSRKGGAVTLEERRREQEEGPDLTLLFAPLKKGPTDLILQKGTELGVRRFVPVITERTQSERVKTDRLTAIAVEAAEQCERLSVPVVEEPLPLNAALEGAERILFCDEAGDDDTARWGGAEGRGAPALDALRGQPREGWSVLIGPEGGFSPQERAMLRGRECALAVSLGPRILKAETATIVALSLWGAALGDLSG
ncbi:16S rRNA (uracil(1498)-N(3))-methyltransferase [Parvularcula oceani]|uniref:16S rRNA (uracil(1498)-N(3))-methyltransferase n=1 Tax=Parvularcula oceani TaxID=1247963 RepID=UPI0004E2577B|nr:16S rRNA (uracil(1498)-N(3))-methyltransferase [Parvularcula oceani]